MEFIHQKDIAHRDLKPENILIDGKRQLKVADVGIAKALYDKLEARGSYQQYMETAAGTRPYMAPEVFNEHYTVSSDVFSIGLVMFVISELPKNPDPFPKLVPLVHNGSNMWCLGDFLHTHYRHIQKSSTSLLYANNCPSDEKELFDSMLQYNYHDRLTAAGVVIKLKSIEDTRERERREAERRRKEEAERKKRRADEKTRIEAVRREQEEAERRQKEQESSWIPKCVIL